MRIADEARLIGLARSGSGSAFDELFRRHHCAVHGLAYHMLGDSDAADDVVQDVFVRAHGALGTFRGDASVRTWIMRIAVNRCVSYQRRAAYQRRESVAAANPPAARTEDPRTAAAVTALASLKPTERSLIVLKDMRGYTYEEIGEMLGCSADAVGVRLYHARTKLRRECVRLSEETEPT